MISIRHLCCNFKIFVEKLIRNGYRSIVRCTKGVVMIVRLYFAGALTAPINYYRAAITPDRELLKKRAQDFKMPRGLLIFGENDSTIDVEVVEKTRRMVYNLTTEVVKGATHFVQQDEPEAVNKAMREFLKSGYETEVKQD